MKNGHFCNSISTCPFTPPITISGEKQREEEEEYHFPLLFVMYVKLSIL